ncbi:MAG: hypothetical protein IID41_01885 [Planctomycetes bacterium]|nr:hypothetical protein [Planctomycetota bacterium]
MPEYTSTLLLIFILASCFYKKHIKDWWWFRFGLYAYGLSILGHQFQHHLRVFSFVLPLATQAAVLASGVSFVVACFRDVKRDLEHIHCLKCNYILKGLTEPRCPECGERI